MHINNEKQYLLSIRFFFSIEFPLWTLCYVQHLNAYIYWIQSRQYDSYIPYMKSTISTMNLHLTMYYFIFIFIIFFWSTSCSISPLFISDIQYIFYSRDIHFFWILFRIPRHFAFLTIFEMFNIDKCYLWNIFISTYYKYRAYFCILLKLPFIFCDSWKNQFRNCKGQNLFIRHSFATHSTLFSLFWYVTFHNSYNIIEWQRKLLYVLNIHIEVSKK